MVSFISKANLDKFRNKRTGALKIRHLVIERTSYDLLNLKLLWFRSYDSMEIQFKFFCSQKYSTRISLSPARLSNSKVSHNGQNMSFFDFRNNLAQTETLLILVS